MPKKIKWNFEINKKTKEPKYRLAKEHCPEGISILVIPKGKKFRIAATYNNQRFYLLKPDVDKPRELSQLNNAKILAEKYASSAEQLKTQEKILWFK